MCSLLFAQGSPARKQLHCAGITGACPRNMQCSNWLAAGLTGQSDCLCLTSAASNLLPYRWVSHHGCSLVAIALPCRSVQV